MRDFTNQTLEGEFADEKFGRLLVATNLTESDSTFRRVSKFYRTRVEYNRVPGLYRWGFLTPPVDGADLRAALDASCLRGALPPVDLPMRSNISKPTGQIKKVEVEMKAMSTSATMIAVQQGTVKIATIVMTYGLFAWYEPLLMTCTDDLVKLKRWS